MTIEEKIKRYRGIPKLLKDLQIDKEICTSVKSVQFDSIGEAKGTHGEQHREKADRCRRDQREDRRTPAGA